VLFYGEELAPCLQLLEASYACSSSQEPETDGCAVLSVNALQFMNDMIIILHIEFSDLVAN
jgi:hypothetical protein